jgi:hypothetical protein
MDVDHPSACRHGRFHRLRNGVRNVVELQVEEDAVAGLNEAMHERRPLARKEPAADFESAGDVLELRGERNRALSVVYVERD